MKFVKKILLSFVMIMSVQHGANAALITVNIPEVSGGNGLIGDYFFALSPNESIVAATFSGTFGNSVFPNSGALKLFLDGIQVGECVQSANCWFTQVTESFSYDFTLAEILSGIFDDGVVSLSQVATAGTTQLGSLQLVLTTRVVNQAPDPLPEPTSLAIIGLGLVGLAARRKLKK